MKFLSIDTATNLLSITAQSESLFAESNFFLPMRQSENLLPLADSLLQKVGLQPDELQFLAVSSGPGSFTGLRLAYATAKAISFVAGTPIFAASSVQTRAWPFRFCEKPVLAVLDAKKSRWYCGIYKGEDEILPPSDLSVSEILQRCDDFFENESIFVAGGEAQEFVAESQNFHKKVRLLHVCGEFSPSKCLAEIACEKFLRGEKPLDIDAAPNYIRASDAESL